MTKIIEELWEEHAQIEKVLNVLERELLVFDDCGTPDYDLIRAAIGYFEEFPEQCHHPKEDLVFRALKARDSGVADAIGDLESEHRKGSKRLRRLSQTVDSILTDHDLPRTAFDDVVRDFIEGERTHMKAEQMLFFPAALRLLQSEDWTQIETDLDRRNEVSRTAVAERFHRLYERVVAWEQENERARV